MTDKMNERWREEGGREMSSVAEAAGPKEAGREEGRDGGGEEDAEETCQSWNARG